MRLSGSPDEFFWGEHVSYLVVETTVDALCAHRRGRVRKESSAHMMSSLLGWTVHCRGALVGYI